MKVDSNTNGHRQWFYFSMKNQKKCKVRLHIYRFRKQYSLFQRGMRPYVRSIKSGDNWKAGGDNICYHYEKQTNDYGVKKETNNYILSFTYTFSHQNDEVFIAAGIPYTYTFLQKQILSFKEQAEKKDNLKFQVQKIGRTMCGLDLQLITIEPKLPNLNSEKRSIVINARTHSGETPSSWILDGFIEEVIQSKQIQDWILADNISFKIIPMLNPDGVFIGNYRTGIIGDDFNRKFNTGKKQFYPEIHALKKLITNCKKSGTVQLFLDLHGHSILKNSFIYGPSQAQSAQFRMNRLPFTLFHASKYFRLDSCKFKAEASLIQTARVFFQVREQILSLTCENSLGLYYNQMQTFQMLEHDWKAFGGSLIHSMKDAFKNKNTESSKPILNQVKPGSMKYKQKPQLILDIQKKISGQSMRQHHETMTSKKNPKIHIKIPSINHKKEEQNRDSTEKYKKLSTSQQLTKEEQLNKLAEQYKLEKLMKLQKIENDYSNKELNRSKFKLKRKSQIIKTPVDCSNPKKMRERTLQKTHHQPYEEIEMQRSNTYDESVQHEINKMKIMESNALDSLYEMEVIPENFSDDYCSINDSDSEGQDLKQQEKNYIFDYIRMNQISKEEKYNANQEEDEANAQINFQAKINKFRQIRFKSLDQEVEREIFKNNLRRIKMQPHKFKESSNKYFKSKYNEMLLSNADFDDPSLVNITQKKKLNQRANPYRRTQKDPFILLQRKERLID